jgi:hypothetical protein
MARRLHRQSVVSPNANNEAHGETNMTTSTSLNKTTKTTGLSIKTSLKAGGLTSNHNRAAK